MSEDEIATPPKGFLTVAPLRHKLLDSGKGVYVGKWQTVRLYLFRPNVRSGDDHEWDLCVRQEEWNNRSVP